MSMNWITTLILATLATVVINYSRAQQVLTATQNGSPRDPLSPDDYFASLMDQFDDAVRGYGLYNLAIHDYTKELDETVYGVELLGTCLYSFGYITNMDPFVLGKNTFGESVFTGEGRISGYIDIPYIEVIYDFQATLTVGDVSGTATHGFPKTRVEVWIERNTTVEGSLPLVSVFPLLTSSTNYTVYVPDTNVTQAIARTARFTTGYVFWDDLTAWCENDFPSLLQNIVDSMEFPL